MYISPWINEDTDLELTEVTVSDHSGFLDKCNGNIQLQEENGRS